MMTQLSDIKKKSSVNAPVAKSTGRASAAQASANSKLGYEILYGRRSNSIQVPLSVPQEDTSSPSTGSALLDSFVTQAIAEPIELQHLRLINIANRQPQSTSPLRQPATPPTAIPQIAAPRTQSSSAKTQEKTRLHASSRTTQKTITAKRATDTIALPSTKTTPPARSKKLFVPAVKVPPLPKPPTTAPAEQPTTPRPSSESTAARPPAPATTKALLEPPPAAAAPATIEITSNQRKPSASTTHKPTAPSLSPSPQPHAPAFAAPVNDSKTARDSAAAVGLIDINDTLLFGGDHQNLASTDPFIGDRNSQNNDTGVLSYLSQQISAFTVSKLKSGFPNNTDPKVINRPDPPKHKTILDLQTFKLSQLDGKEPATPQNQQRTKVQSQKSAPSSIKEPEFNALSQQVNVLNKKIAELSQKLDQVTKEQSN